MQDSDNTIHRQLTTTHKQQAIGACVKYKYLFLALFCSFLIFRLSSISNPIPWWHGVTGREILLNLGHIPAYALLTFLWLMSVPVRKNGNRSLVVILSVLAGIVCFSVSDEIHQSFTPGRDPSLMDVGLDLVGFCLGLSIYHVTTRPEAQEKIGEP